MASALARGQKLEDHDRFFKLFTLLPQFMQHLVDVHI